MVETAAKRGLLTHLLAEAALNVIVLPVPSTAPIRSPRLEKVAFVRRHPRQQSQCPPRALTVAPARCGFWRDRYRRARHRRDGSAIINLTAHVPKVTSTASAAPRAPAPRARPFLLRWIRARFARHRELICRNLPVAGRWVQPARPTKATNGATRPAEDTDLVGTGDTAMLAWPRPPRRTQRQSHGQQQPPPDRRRNLNVTRARSSPAPFLGCAGLI